MLKLTSCHAGVEPQGGDSVNGVSILMLGGPKIANHEIGFRLFLICIKLPGAATSR